MLQSIKLWICERDEICLLATDFPECVIFCANKIFLDGQLCILYVSFIHVFCSKVLSYLNSSEFFVDLRTALFVCPLGDTKV